MMALRRSHVGFEDQTLRDGLQSEPRRLSLVEKRQLIDGLVQAGLKRIQVGSFVHPRRVPQMADTDELVRALKPPEGVVFSGLVLNARGLDRALACGLSDVALSASVSDSHSRRNANQGATAAIDAVAGLIREAVQAGLAVRGGLQCVFGCVDEGVIDPDRVLAAAEKLAAAGARTLNLADTTGMAHPRQVAALCARIGKALPDIELILHLHDTRGLGLANMLAGFEAGVRSFDVCTGGLGGCPFVRGAAGNVPTEDAVHAFEAMGVDTGIDLDGLVRVVDALERLFERRLPGRMAAVLRAAREKAGACGTKADG
jgi:hydroxymethylglutaryl-CoA lyase